MDEDRLPLANAVEGGVGGADGVDEAAAVAVGADRAEDGDGEVAAGGGGPEDLLALGLVEGVGEGGGGVALGLVGDRVAGAGLVETSTVLQKMSWSVRPQTARTALSASAGRKATVSITASKGPASVIRRSKARKSVRSPAR